MSLLYRYPCFRGVIREGFHHKYNNLTSESIETQRISLWCLIYSRTDPLFMKGIISSGLSADTQTPRRDMTLVCSSINMVDTSFANRSTSSFEKSAGSIENIVWLSL